MDKQHPTSACSVLRFTTLRNVKLSFVDAAVAVESLQRIQIHTNLVTGLLLIRICYQPVSHGSR